MHRTRNTTTLAALLLFASAGTSRAQATHADSTARPALPSATEMTAQFAPVPAMLISAAKLGPGKNVMILGNRFMLPLMEQTAIEIERSGANAMMVVTTDSLERVRLGLPAAQRLGRAATVATSLNDADLTITFPYAEDFHVYANQSPASLKISGEVDSLLHAKRRITESHGRELYVGVPLPADTIQSNLGYAALAHMRWDAIRADYSSIAATGATLARQIAAARRVRVTSPEGTDITFSPVKDRINVDAGPLTAATAIRRGVPSQLPGGYLFAIVDPTSATGSLHAPLDWCNVRVEDEVIAVDHGKPTKVSASRDEECIRNVLLPLRAGILLIGLNPSNESAATGGPLSFSDMYGAGMVAFGFGSNLYGGGTDAGPGQWLVPLPRATVYADGVPIVRDGRIIGGQEQAGNH